MFVNPTILNDIAEAATAIGTFITAIGVIIGARQLHITREQSLTTFEDTLSKEYRELATRLPTKALLGEELTEEEHAASFDEFYHYFDLCNEQVFLRQIKRVSLKTWTFWRDGIRANLGRPAFQRAWQEISTRAPNDFNELRTLIASGYQLNPNRMKTVKASSTVNSAPSVVKTINSPSPATQDKIQDVENHNV